MDRKCARCSSLAKNNKTCCENCLSIVNIKTKNRRIKNLSNGLCYRCGKCPHLINKRMCASCLTRTKKWGKNTRFKLKLLVFINYGGAICKCCGEDTIEFLTIDHINGGGNAHRREIFGKAAGTGSSFYRWLKKNCYPTGYQVLCFNCNVSKHMFGICPHQKRKKNG